MALLWSGVSDSGYGAGDLTRATGQVRAWKLICILVNIVHWKKHSCLFVKRSSGLNLCQMHAGKETLVQ